MSRNKSETEKTDFDNFIVVDILNVAAYFIMAAGKFSGIGERSLSMWT